jgi:hypothetical protein
MCRSVLNDERVSHPTWSNEDSDFPRKMYAKKLYIAARSDTSIIYISKQSSVPSDGADDESACSSISTRSPSCPTQSAGHSASGQESGRRCRF